ncbi:MAG: hypothetical protein K1X53_07215 [Candidatus Sumerlaeaceae bacterium]|nr:hypothetical protein [Candidatus Sumerlaeaceae bacterium]
MRHFLSAVVYIVFILALNFCCLLSRTWPLYCFMPILPFLAEPLAGIVDTRRGTALSYKVGLFRMVLPAIAYFPVIGILNTFAPVPDYDNETILLRQVLAGVQSVTAGLAFIWHHRLVPYFRAKGFS